VTASTAGTAGSTATVDTRTGDMPTGDARTVEVRTADGGTAGSVELPAEVFDVSANVSLLHQVVVAQLAAARQGTHSTKTRGEVSGGGAKPYRQKGTGRARQGSTRAPQFAGGGTVHGPTPRNYEQRTPKKMKVAALRGALSDRARGGRVHVVASLVDADVPSTKAATTALAGITSARHVLVVARREDELTWKSLRNVGSVHLLDPGQLNTYDVLISDDVVFLESALHAFLASAARGRARLRAGRPAQGLPDLEPHSLAGGLPSMAPPPGSGTVASSSASQPAETAPAAADETEPVLEAEPAGDTKPSEVAEPAAVAEPASEPATEAGTTTAAGAGLSTQELADQVADQTDSNLVVDPNVETRTGDANEQGEGAR